MTIWIAFAGWRGDYAVLGVYDRKEMADERSQRYNDETGYRPDSGNESVVVPYEVQSSPPTTGEPKC